MIWEVAKKEFLEKILDSRVTISFLIAITLTILAVFVVSEEYRSEKSAYDRAIANSQEALREVKVFSQYKPDVLFPPSPLSVFSRGIDLPFPVVVNIRLDWVPRFEPSIAGANPLMRMFDKLDIATVLRILFALLVILITYDSISREKESGTLRLVLSNPVSRMKVLQGKLIGSLLIVAVVVLVTFSIALLLLQLFSGVTLGAEDYSRSLLILGLTLLYLSAFGAFGVLTSIKFRHSSTSLVVSLLIWLVVAILQPNVNTYIVSEFGGTADLDEVRPVLEQAKNSYLKELERLQDQYGHLVEDRAKPKFFEGQTRIGTVILYQVVADADYEVLEYLIKQTQIYRKSAEAAEKEWDLYKNLYLNRLDTQLHGKRILELFSPAALLTHSVSVLSGTNIDNIEDFLLQARQHRHRYLAYLDQKGVFSTNAQSFFSRLARDQINREATARRLAQYAKDAITIPWTQTQSPLDLSDAPVFGAWEPVLIVDCKKAGHTAVPLIVYVGLLIIVAARGFGIYDAR